MKLNDCNCGGNIKKTSGLNKRGAKVFWVECEGCKQKTIGYKSSSRQKATKDWNNGVVS